MEREEGEGREEEHLSHCILLQGAGEGKSAFEVYYVCLIFMYKEYYLRHCKQCLTLFLLLFSVSQNKTSCSA